MKRVILVSLFLLFSQSVLAMSNPFDSKEYRVQDTKYDMKDQIGFYQSNYPNCTSNEKAEMIIKSFTEQKFKFSVSDRYYKVKVTCIFKDGERLWPIQSIYGEVLEEKFRAIQGVKEDGV